MKPYKNYINFKGRARRKEYWLFLLINILIIVIFMTLDTVIDSRSFSEMVSGVLAIYMLFNIVPFLALIVRRLHDVGKSGWYWFIRFIPIIGGIWLLILLCTDSQKGPNKWGDNPKGFGNLDDIDLIGSE